jgi:hypothetical protein
MTDAILTAAHPDAASPHEQPAERLVFSNRAQRMAHVAAFRAWLPAALHDAPDTDWDAIPSQVMGYLIRCGDDIPHVEALALAAACIHGTKEHTLLVQCRQIGNLLQRLRRDYGLRALADLAHPDIWERYTANRDLSPHEANSIYAYARAAARDVPAWLESLGVAERARWTARAFPYLPPRFLERFSQGARVKTESEGRQKARSDILVPLYPLLVTLAQLRKQALQRLLGRFRDACAPFAAGAATFPYRFAMTETLRVLSEDALTLPEAYFVEREVTLQFTLWDSPSWILAHPERHDAATVRRARKRAQVAAGDPQRGPAFLQYDGAPEALFWFGDILAARLLQHSKGVKSLFDVERPGLLQPAGGHAQSLLRKAAPGEILFELESLYRGVLYGAALAATVMTNACRLSELLQISMERFVVELVPEFDEHLRKTGHLIPCAFQHLLPKGCSHESQRQLFLITPEVADLLNEIAAGLEVAHGEIPIVETIHGGKAEDLPPARYLFQWGASGDGRLGLLPPADVVSLIRFLFHGLRLTTAQGDPIIVATHLLRHVASAYARHYRQIPGEVVARHLLHHTLIRANTPGGPQYLTSALTDYYTRLPERDQLGLLYTLQARYRVSAERILVMPDAHDLAAMEDHFRAVFERWGAIAPVTFGWCGSPGLCVRPDNRTHCLGCGYLQPDWRRFANIAPHREIYQRVLARAEEQGLHTETKQAMQQLASLDGLAAVMQAQYIAWKDRQEVSVVDRVLGPNVEELHHAPTIVGSGSATDR